MKKYELTSESKIGQDGGLVYRIKALRDIKEHDVAKGDLGGFVTGYANLAQNGECWIAKEASVEGNAFVCNNAWVSDKAALLGNSRLQDNSYVYRSAIVRDSEIKGDCEVFGITTVQASKLEGKVKVYGHASIKNSRINGIAALHDKCKVMESVIKGEDISIAGDAKIVRATIGTEKKVETLLICNKASVNEASISGKGVYIGGAATIQTGVKVHGDSIHISDYVVLTGRITIGSGASIREVAELENVHIPDYLLIEKTTVSGDYLVRM